MHTAASHAARNLVNLVISRLPSSNDKAMAMPPNSY